MLIYYDNINNRIGFNKAVKECIKPEWEYVKTAEDVNLITSSTVFTDDINLYAKIVDKIYINSNADVSREDFDKPVKLFTSYYANIRTLPKFHKDKLLTISRTHPKGLTLRGSIKELHPSSQLLKDYKNDLISEEEYQSRYYNETLKKLTKINIKGGCVLLCWEKSDKFCHRHLVSDFLNENTNYRVLEYSREEK